MRPARGRARGVRAAARALAGGECACAAGAFFVAVLLAVAPVARAEVLHVTGGTAELAAALDAARPGDVVELGPGRYAGPVRIEQSLILRGRGGVIDGGGRGTPLRIVAAGARVEGLTVRASGTDIGAPDACIYVEPGATGASVQGCTLEECAFGIWVHTTDGVHLVGNHVRGRASVRVADRGNGIHLFDASNVLVRGNVVEDVRDGIYVSATEDSLIEENQANGVRFGVHYMYSVSYTHLTLPTNREV